MIYNTFALFSESSLNAKKNASFGIHGLGKMMHVLRNAKRASVMTNGKLDTITSQTLWLQQKVTSTTARNCNKKF